MLLFMLASWRTSRRGSRSNGTASDAELPSNGFTGSAATTASDAKRGSGTVRYVGPSKGFDVQDGPIMYEGRWNKLMEDGITKEKWRKSNTV